MKQLKIDIADDLKQKLKVLAASRGESVQALLTRLVTYELEVNRIDLADPHWASKGEETPHIEGLPAEEEHLVLHQVAREEIAKAFMLLECSTCMREMGHFYAGESKNYRCAYCGTSVDGDIPV